MRMPVDRMTNWEMMRHIESELGEIHRRFLDEMGSDQREIMLQLESDVHEACLKLRKVWEWHDQHAPDPMPDSCLE